MNKNWTRNLVTDSIGGLWRWVQTSSDRYMLQHAGGQTRVNVESVEIVDGLDPVPSLVVREQPTIYINNPYGSSYVDASTLVVDENGKYVSGQWTEY